MRRSLTVKRSAVTTVLLFLLAMVISCASAEKLEEQISGTWQRTEAQEAVVINLVDDSKSISIGEKNYPATIEKVDVGNYLVNLKVQTESGAAEIWTLRQVWDNNGSDFKLVLDRTGNQETLVHSKHS
jgi:hypothetical protein